MRKEFQSNSNIALNGYAMWLQRKMPRGFFTSNPHNMFRQIEAIGKAFLIDNNIPHSKSNKENALQVQRNFTKFTHWVFANPEKVKRAIQLKK